jgi:hypothetical protein
MSEAKHTAGPWRLLPDEGEGYLRVRGTRLGHRFKVANVMAPNFLPRDELESKANARLIAAAPEMLEALQRAAQSAGFQYMTFETREAIDAALAKARESA